MEQVLLYCLGRQVGDWTIRVDPPHGQKEYHRRHVHIKKRGLGGEYSWNEDGTRHDKHRFPRSDACIGAAKNHAASALGIPVSSLSFLVGEAGGARIALWSNDGTKTRLPLFNAYVRVRFSLVFFGSPQGLVMVLQDDV